MFVNPAEATAHGSNEKLRAAALYEGQEFLCRLTKALAPAGVKGGLAGPGEHRSTMDRQYSFRRFMPV
jgi:hypothetical protein